MDCRKEADEVINAVKQAIGLDYSSERDKISEFFDGYLYEGNWDGILEFKKIHNLRFIQGDEFDQHRTDTMPKWEDQICYAAGHYIFLDGGLAT
jgi:hypothetical protein